MKAKYQPGDKVRMTGKFLRNTGQAVGGEGLSRWIVEDCGCGLCRTGRFVATNQRSEDGLPATSADRANPAENLRHINAGNLQRVK